MLPEWRDRSAAHDEDAAIEHRPAKPQDLIGHPPARQRQHVHQRDVGPVDRPGLRDVPAQSAGRGEAVMKRIRMARLP